MSDKVIIFIALCVTVLGYQAIQTIREVLQRRFIERNIKNLAEFENAFKIFNRR